MKGKFSCKKNYECIIPKGMSNEEIEKNHLPHSCLECEYYTMETQNGEVITCCEWKNRQKR